MIFLYFAFRLLNWLNEANGHTEKRLKSIKKDLRLFDEEYLMTNTKRRRNYKRQTNKFERTNKKHTKY